MSEHDETLADIVAEMREAIVKCVNLIIEYGNAEIIKTPLDVIVDIEAIIKSALAAPARNCDVGTAEEQIKRWEEFCLEHHEYWKPSKGLTAIQRCNCPCREGNGCNYFIWAQMPYTEGGEA